MAEEKDMVKVAYGPKSHIGTALANNQINDNDIVVTSDTHEMAYITDDKETKYIKSRNLLFDSVPSAITTLNSSTDTYAGQIVMIKNKYGSYDPYTVQNSTNGTGYTVSQIKTETSPSLTWHKIGG